MDAQVEAATAAQRAVEQAVLAMLFPRATAADLARLSPPPPWICKALERLIVLIGVLLHDQHHVPRRAELASRFAPLQEHIGRLPLLIGTTLNEQLRLPSLLDKLSRRGSFSVLDLLGYPSPKLEIACAVTALHLAYRNYVPSERSRHALALCAALLMRAAEWAEVPMPKESQEPDKLRTQWGHPLRQARKSVMTIDPNGAGVLSFAWWVVQTALKPIADQASFNSTSKCRPGEP
jgi:hypothetical protein